MIGSAVHHPAFAAPDGWPFSHDDCVGVWDSVISQHATAGYNPSPAYNYGPCQHGIIQDGRTFARLSGANGTTWSNLNFWAYCALLPMGHEPSAALLTALLQLIEAAPGPGREVYPHNRFVATACPNPPLSVWIEAGCPAPVLLVPAPTEYVVANYVFRTDPGGAPHKHTGGRVVEITGAEWEALLAAGVKEVPAWPVAELDAERAALAREGTAGTSAPTSFTVSTVSTVKPA